MKIILVFNPKSGSTLSKNELRRKCRDTDIEIEAFVEIQDGFEKKLAPHIAKGKSIAVLGGDGTISAVAGCMVNTKATLVPLPGGTLNHFTKDLGISQDIDEALQSLKSKRARYIDIASVDDTYFINNSSIGIYPASLRRREEIESTVGKWPAAVAASLRALLTLKTYDITINSRAITTPFVFIGNNRYELNSFGTTERTRLDEGVLTIYVAKTRSRLMLLKIAIFALLGKANQLPEFDEFHTTSLTIETRKKRLSVSHDGEVSRMTTPLAYQLHAKALKIIV